MDNNELVARRDSGVDSQQTCSTASILDHPTYETHEGRASPSGSSVKIARDFEDMAKVFAIRGAAYLTDPEHIYSKHFDGNDFSATHLLGFLDGEPAATIRIRYFSDFARIERLAVIPQKRKSRMSFQIAKASFNFCRDKGYREIRGVAREELLPFWSVLGFRIDQAKDPIHIYGMPHFEMIRTLEPNLETLTSAADPLTLLRPEGRWKVAGFHETSNAPARQESIDLRQTNARGRQPGDIAAKRRFDPPDSGGTANSPSALPQAGMSRRLHARPGADL
ncbi:MAG: GNAT family N-acetyltransferase [Beijerinckiaceae bacterium]